MKKIQILLGTMGKMPVHTGCNHGYKLLKCNEVHQNLQKIETRLEVCIQVINLHMGKIQDMALFLSQ